MDTLTIENSRFELYFSKTLWRICSRRLGCVYARALRLRTDSYDLRVPRDNLARPTCGSQLSTVHKQGSSVNWQKVYAHPSDALSVSTNRSGETVWGIYECWFKTPLPIRVWG